MKLYINKGNILDQIAIITIGFPFASFKLLLGITFFKMLFSPVSYIVGTILIGWSIVDFLINGINLFMLLFRDRYLTNVCLLTSIFASKNSCFKNNHLAWKELGTALDVMLSFFLVAVMVGGNLFHYLSDWEFKLWSVSVVVNVLGAGITRIFLSIQRVKNVHTI
jgi:hypothetical protein